MSRPRVAVATLGRLPELDAKMAHGVLRYCDNVVAVLDPRYAGRNLLELLPYAGRDLPIIADLDQAAALDVAEVVIGASPPGGRGDADLAAFVTRVLRRGMWLVHGLHTSFADAPEVAAARERLVELRHVPVADRIATGASAAVESTVVLTVGSDCAAGKMTTALDLCHGLHRRGHSAAFVATGQTGMYIAGTGAPIDAVRSDFVAGAVEQLVLDAAGHDVVLVEGQGSILHPAYSGVSLSLLHGSAPNALVFCHELERRSLAYFDRSVGDLVGQIGLLERLAGAQRPARVVAVVAMTRRLSDAQARAARRDLSHELGLPVFSPGPGLEALVELIGELR